MDNYKHIYVLDILYEDKEIMITRSQTLLWNLIPFNPADFEIIKGLFSDYRIIEVDDRIIRMRSDLRKLLNPN